MGRLELKTTQTDVAREAGLDVSSVNKILNEVPGPVFRQDTIKRVRRIARALGYELPRHSKGRMRGLLERALGLVQEQEALLEGFYGSIKIGITVQQSNQYLALLGRADVLLKAAGKRADDIAGPVRFVDGRRYLTLRGLNLIRAHLGYEPIQIRPGESIDAWKARVQEAKRDLFRNHPGAATGFEAGVL